RGRLLVREAEAARRTPGGDGRLHEAPCPRGKARVRVKEEQDLALRQPGGLGETGPSAPAGQGDPPRSDRGEGGGGLGARSAVGDDHLELPGEGEEFLGRGRLLPAEGQD